MAQAVWNKDAGRGDRTTRTAQADEKEVEMLPKRDGSSLLTLWGADRIFADSIAYLPPILKVYYYSILSAKHHILTTTNKII